MSRVLVVDDEIQICKAIARALQRAAVEVVTAHDGDSALRSLEQCEVDLVISDFCMPRMTGGELVSEIAKRWPRTICIILSGYASEPVHCEWLIKPCEAKRLVEIVRTRLGLP